MIGENKFDYDEAFQRNIGLISKEEQHLLKDKVIGIAGTGGVGGEEIISLVRAGFEKFKIADYDEYELKNFNRQFGANINTINRKKAQVIKEMALKINPNCQIEVFNEAITKTNIKKFLYGIDLVVDGIEFFHIDDARNYFNTALENNIPVIFAAPIGLGASLLIFMPGGPNFDKYFRYKETMTDYEKAIAFGLGVTPSLLQLPYMKNIKLKKKQGPSFIGSVNICAGLVAITALKILLKRGDIKPAPYYMQFDVYRNKLVYKKQHLNRFNIWYKIKFNFAKAKFEKEN